MRRRLAEILLLVGSLLFSGLLAERTLRVIRFSNPYFYTFEDQTGWTLRPHVAGRVNKEGSAYVHINSVGMRDSEHTRQKPAGTYRIAVLGDSFAEAMQVDIEQTFWRLLQTDLSSCSPLNGQSIEVLNFGVSSYGTAQELLALRSRVWNYEPDMVLLAFVPANDVRNNSRGLEKDELRPYFVTQGDTLIADMSFRDAPAHQQKMSRWNNALYDAINCCRLLQLLSSVKEAVQSRRAAAADATGPERGVDDEGFIPPSDQDWVDAWHTTEGMIVEMNREVTSHAAKFIVVSLTYGPQVDPDPANREHYARRLGVSDLLYAGRRIEQLGGREGFVAIDLVPPFQDHATRHHVALHGFGKSMNQGHWNQAGHALASTTIAPRVCVATD